MAGTRGNFHDTDNKRPWQRFTLAFGTTAIETDMLRSNLLISLLLLVFIASHNGSSVKGRESARWSRTGLYISSLGSQCNKIYNWRNRKRATVEISHMKTRVFWRGEMRLWPQMSKHCSQFYRWRFGRKFHKDGESTRVQSALAVKSAR